MTDHYKLRVYFEDTDAAGVVYHGNYLKFMERARTEWLIDLEIGMKYAMETHQVVFAVTRTETNYIRSARLEDQLEVSVELVELKRASVVFKQVVRRNSEILCEGITRVACLTFSDLRPTPIPPAMYAKLKTQLAQ